LVPAGEPSSYQALGIFNLLIDMAEKINGIKGEPDSKWSRS
jgi:hypothetical protein